MPQNFLLSSTIIKRLLDGDKNCVSIGQLIGPSAALAAVEVASTSSRPVLLLANNPIHGEQLEAEVRWFTNSDVPVQHFADLETLPYDSFAPHQDILSQRLNLLSFLPKMTKGIVIMSSQSLNQRLPPVDYITSRTLTLQVNQELAREAFVTSLTNAGYIRAPQVHNPSEYAVRGSLLDIFPMGSTAPIRIDFLGNDIDTIRYFDPDSQRSNTQIDSIKILPAREVPLDSAGIKFFRHSYRERFEGNPSQSRVYREISDGIAHGGIEYYLPLFFERTATIFDYLPNNTIIFQPKALESLLQNFWKEIEERHELCNLDQERPILKPEETFIPPKNIMAALDSFQQISCSSQSLVQRNKQLNLSTRIPPPIRFEARYEDSANALIKFLNSFDGRILFTAESPGRRENVYELLIGRNFPAARIDDWQTFYRSTQKICVTVAPIEDGVILPESQIAIVSEHLLFGNKPQHRIRKRRADRDPETIIRQLNDLTPQSPVVHSDYGIGRYLGLKMLQSGGIEAEFLHIEYADGDKLYVPVHALDLISRYTGASPENAPLHRLGSGQWSKAKKRAIDQIRDTAAELLDVYARRAARKGHSFRWSELEYRAFESGFPFELTEDQDTTITEVLADLESDQPMDRLVCGDVGFGKTEVALRASFAVVHGGKQVAILVPTTLLAQQHGQTFQDRFADWPIQVEVLSRFCSPREAKRIIAGIESGHIDIVIGTHRLLNHIESFSDVGLVIVDEEHRFGVRHKEAIKSLRSEVDILTLTATPIPRTLNMSLGGVREMSLITTPPAERLSVKTFVTEWNDVNIREACLREIKRGGQVYFIHNRVKDISNIEERLKTLVPEANCRIAHGQMPERDLEQVMLDFYHRRFNVLLCTTIIESGIDVPTANTIIINRADRFGLAQLHQLRGRVGRSHHRAYAYLIAPPQVGMTADAIKRLEAIDSLEDLGSGFTLATHDLEIRGAGELLGESQSGQIQEIGFSLYTELLGRAVESLKSGEVTDFEKPLDSGVEINLKIPALLPEEYVPDVHLRLILYKRIASASSYEELREMQIELIDRFGLLPEPAKNHMRLAALKLEASILGIKKIDVADGGGYVAFGKHTEIDPLVLVKLVEMETKVYQLTGAHRLKFKQELTDHEQRFKFIEDLLVMLSTKHVQSLQ